MQSAISLEHIDIEEIVMSLLGKNSSALLIMPGLLNKGIYSMYRFKDTMGLAHLSTATVTNLVGCRHLSAGSVKGVYRTWPLFT